MALKTSKPNLIEARWEASYLLISKYSVGMITENRVTPIQVHHELGYINTEGTPRRLYNRNGEYRASIWIEGVIPDGEPIQYLNTSFRWRQIPRPEHEPEKRRAIIDAMAVSENFRKKLHQYLTDDEDLVRKIYEETVESILSDSFFKAR